MILLHYVVQILDLPDPDGRFPLGVDGLQGGQIGAWFENRRFWVTRTS
jgi:hypothetical protein